jgi:hypothetical protein
MRSPKATTKRKLPKKIARQAKVTIHKLPTGVRGLDDILGGGIPEFSFNMVRRAAAKPRWRIKFYSRMQRRRTRRSISPSSANPP